VGKRARREQGKTGSVYPAADTETGARVTDAVFNRRMRKTTRPPV
jgi:hypothetical protein